MVVQKIILSQSNLRLARNTTNKIKNTFINLTRNIFDKMDKMLEIRLRRKTFAKTDKILEIRLTRNTFDKLDKKYF